MTRAAKRANGNGKVLATQQSVNQVVWSICDIMRRSNCAGALQYVPELTWILFLRILDEREQKEARTAAALETEFRPSLEAPYRWHDWAAPFDEKEPLASARDGVPQGWKRHELSTGTLNAFISFVNAEMLPYLRGLKERPNATPRQKVISEIMSGVEKTRVDTQKNFLDVLDKVHEISEGSVDTTHVFPLSQVFEGLLLKMGEKGNDGGQFFTPREVIRTVIRVIDPQINETVYDPSCGTGGFLAQAFEHMAGDRNANITSPDQLRTLKHQTFYGREKDNVIYPICLANLILHGIDEPHVWHGNTLSGEETYGGLFESKPDFYDVILTNPPFGGKESKEVQKRFDYETSATQVLFLQHVIKSLKQGGRCGVVLDEGVLFRTNEAAFVQTKRKLVEECDLWCVVSLPGGVFGAAGAGVKTNLLFFTKGRPTEKIWYYDLSGLKVGKKNPLTIDKFSELFALLPARADGERSWTVDLTARRGDAKKQADPLRARAQSLTDEALQLRGQVKELKKRNDPASQARVEELTDGAAALEGEARELRAKAQGIEDAVYDLKAVNLRAKSEEDARTPQELLDLIEAKGREVTEALSALRAMS